MIDTLPELCPVPGAVGAAAPPPTKCVLLPSLMGQGRNRTPIPGQCSCKTKPIQKGQAFVAETAT